MPIKYQNRRGTSTEANTITLSEGELYMDLTNKKLRIHDGILAGGYELARTSDLTSKQATLVSGTNIKTVNGTSILGSGDLSVTQLTLASEVNIPNALKDLVSNTTQTVPYSSLTTTTQKFSDEAGSIVVTRSASGVNSFPVTTSLPATYEFWYYPDQPRQAYDYMFAILGQDLNNISIDTTAGLYYSDNTNGSSGAVYTQNSSLPVTQLITTGTWNHVAIYLTSTSINAWFNGTKVYDLSFQSGYEQSKPRIGIKLGGHYNGWLKPSGYYGEVCVTSGDKYGVSNSTITVPTSSFTTNANTTFLLKYTKGTQRITVGGDIIAQTVQANSFTGSSINLGNGNITAGAITATSITGNGSGLTNLPTTPINYLIRSIGWQQTVSIANYTVGQFQTSNFSETITPTKTGTLLIEYYPKDIYFFQNIGNAYFSFNVISNGTTYSDDDAIGSVTTGSRMHGPYRVSVPVTANSPITLNMQWLLQSASGSNSTYFNYAGNGMNSTLYAQYITTVSGSTI